MFTDLVDSTRLRTSLGDDAVDRILDDHHANALRVAARHDGVLVKGTGDGCLMTFRTVRSALDAAVELCDVTSRERVGSFRFGLHAGEVRDEGDVLGEAVNAASRITSLASGGQILVSQVVRDLAGTVSHRLEEHGTHELRGFPRPWVIHRVVPGSDDAVPGRVVATLLGDELVRRDGDVIEPLCSTRAIRALALLALAPSRRLSRQRLAFGLWPDSTDAQARTNLRKLVHELRSDVPELDTMVIVDGSTVGLAEHLEVDVVEVRRAIAAGDGPGVVRFYGGDLLPSCYDDWVLAEREQLRLAAMDVVERSIETTDDDEMALRLATALMQHDPLREAGYRSAMELLGRRGQRAEALRLYHRCVQVLDRELSVAPSPDTVAVYERLRSTSPTDPPVDDRRPIPSARRARLIGRGAELDRILGAWERTRGGGSGVVLVTGEPGVGKSRLVAEASRMIGSRGAVVAATRSYESAARAPWGPVAEWLRSEPLRGRVARLEPTWRSHVARLTPDLVPDSFDVAAGPDAVTNGRRLLLDALVAALATSTSTMLVLDDLQWCDDDTIELVGRLATVPSPLLVVLTARSVELELHQRASALVGELRRDGGLVEIDLEPLDRTSTIELAREVTCAGDDVDLTRWWDETEGNPLFVVELARASLADAGAGPQVLPATVRAVIDSRLGQLGQAARQVAEVAATIGRGFESSVITMVTGQSDDELVDPLDELWRLRVIREQGTGYDFSHDKVREVLLRSIGPARLRRLHREIADALERLSGDDLGPSSREIARHRAAAGLHAAAADAYRRTARVAADLWALPDAVECLEQALRCLAELPATPERFATEAEVNIELAVALVQLTGWGSERTLAAYERAAALRRRCRVPVDPAIIRGLGVAHVLRCDLHRALTYATELLDLAGDDVMVAVEGHYLLGVTHSWRGDHALAEEHLRAAIERYDPARGADHVVHFAQDPRAICLVRLSLTRLWRGDVAGAEHLMAQAVAHAEAIDHPWTQVYVLVWQFMLAVELGDIDRAARAVEQLELSHERYGDLAYMLSIDSAARGWCDAHVDPHRGAELLRRSLGDWRDSVQPLHYTWVAQLLAALCLRTDAIDEGRAVLAEALRFADDSEQRYIEPSLWITEAELRHRAGDAVGAQRALEEALSVAGRQGAEWYADVARSRLDAMSSRA